MTLNNPRTTFNEYQQYSQRTAEGYANPNNTNVDTETQLLFLATAVNGEAGELGEKAKKYVREDDDEYLNGLEDEVGDVLWCLSQIATLLDIDLGGVADSNLEKLLDRQDRGVITGSGDNR